MSRVSPVKTANLNSRLSTVSSAIAFHERLKKTQQKFTNKVRPFQVHLEGNIASGKTTLLSSLEGNSDMSLQYEPVEEWVYSNSEEGTPNLLAEFYKDPKGHAEVFQRLILNTYQTLHDIPCSAPIRVFDRSLHSSEIFREALAEDGYLSTRAYEDLQFYYEALNSQVDASADLVIYLKTNPAGCFRRLVTRDRPEERNVTLSYMTRIHRAHENWISQCPFRVITLDGELPQQEIKDRAIRIIYREFSETRIRAFTKPYESTKYAPLAALASMSPQDYGIAFSASQSTSPELPKSTPKPADQSLFRGEDHPSRFSTSVFPIQQHPQLPQ